MELRKNRSSTYIFPLIFNELIKKGCDKDILKFILNTYLEDENNLFTITLHLVDFENTKPISKEVLQSLIMNELIEEDSYSQIVPGIISVKIKKIEEFNDTINLFKMGLYSKIQEKHKAIILDFNFKNSSVDYYAFIGGVLYKDKALRRNIAEELGIELGELPYEVELDSVINDEEQYNAGKAKAIKEAYTEIQRESKRGSSNSEEDN